MFSQGKLPSIQRAALGLNSACASSRTEASIWRCSALMWKSMLWRPLGGVLPRSLGGGGVRHHMGVPD